MSSETLYAIVIGAVVGAVVGVPLGWLAGRRSRRAAEQRHATELSEEQMQRADLMAELRYQRVALEGAGLSVQGVRDGTGRLTSVRIVPAEESVVPPPLPPAPAG